jgi:hypothetical protein
VTWTIDLFDQLGFGRPSRIPGRVLCPRGHDTEPSLVVWDDHVHCFGCGLHADNPYQLLRKLGISWNTARVLIDNASWTDVPSSRTDEAPVLDLSDKLRPAWKADARDRARRLCTELWGLDLERLEDVWGVVVGNEHLYVPHYQMVDGQIIVPAIKCRGTTPDAWGRKTSVRGSRYIGLYRCPDFPVTSVLVLAEGESDTWLLSSLQTLDSRFSVAGLPSGAMHWHPDWVPEETQHVVIATDNDRAGDEAARRMAESLQGRCHVWRVRPPRGKDWIESRNADLHSLWYKVIMALEDITPGDELTEIVG